MNSDNTKFAKPDNIFFKKSEKGTYVLANADDDDFSIVELDGTAFEIWEKLMEGLTFKQIYEWMSETFEGEVEQMKTDLDEFINDLVEKNYLAVST